MNTELAQLSRIAAGDTDAFGAWASSIELSLRGALRPFAAVVDAEAVLQETLLRVWQVAPKFVHDGKPNALLRFAVTTGRNYAVSQLRRTAPTAEALDALERELATELHVAPLQPDPMLRSAIAKCRERLPKQPAAAMEQRLFASGGEADATLAERVNMSLNTFLQNVTRARRLLAECLKKAGIDLDAELSP